MTFEGSKGGAMMRALVYRRYGSPDVLRVEDVPRPAPHDGEVLVRVAAASLNAIDWHLIRGLPYIARASAGWRAPKRNIPGVDVSGTVEAVGAGVTTLAPGDEVFAHKGRALAQYVCGKAELFLPRPSRLTLEEAAAVPAAGLTAFLALRDTARLRPGETVLVNGASGGVGTFTVQIAKALGAHVTAATRTETLDQAGALGADEVIDYTRDDITRLTRRFDVVVDNGGNHPVRALRRLLVPTGRLVLIGAPEGRWLAPVVRLLLAPQLSRIGTSKVLMHITSAAQGDLADLVRLIKDGKVTPVIDRRYPLAQAADGVRYLETLRARGKVVITV